MKSTSWDAPGVNPNPVGNLLDDLIEVSSEEMAERVAILRHDVTNTLVSVISKKGTRVVRSALAGMRARRAAGRLVNPLPLLDYYNHVDYRRNVEVPADSVAFVVLTGWPRLVSRPQELPIVQGERQADGTSDWSVAGFPEVDDPVDLAEQTVALAERLPRGRLGPGGREDDLLSQFGPADLANLIHTTPGFEKYPLTWLLPRLKAMVALRANQAESDALPV